MTLSRYGVVAKKTSKKVPKNKPCLGPHHVAPVPHDRPHLAGVTGPEPKVRAPSEHVHCVDDVIVRQLLDGLLVVLPYLQDARLEALGLQGLDQVAVHCGRQGVRNVLLALVEPFSVAQALEIVVVVTCFCK